MPHPLRLLTPGLRAARDAKAGATPPVSAHSIAHTLGLGWCRFDPDHGVESRAGLPPGCLEIPAVRATVARILAGEPSPLDLYFQIGSTRWFGRVAATPIWGLPGQTLRGALLVVHPIPGVLPPAP